ncbi:MAG: hypothetical protein DRP29_00565 [Thermodesulfobacteriota bacterium]|nr:MAG: hypothetical protein DRP29_00565 [Thermodesulfobacteriota bacterium]
MGKGGKKFPFEVILGWARNFTNFTWNALKGVRGVFTKTFGWIRGGFSVFRNTFSFLKDNIAKIWNFYKTYIHPAIDTLRNFVNKFRLFVEEALDKLTGGLYSLYKNVTELWKNFRKEIVVLRGRIADLVDVFDRKLAERIRDTTDRILEEVDRRIFKVYDILDKKVFRYIRIVEDRIDALEVAIERIFRPVRDTLDRLDKLISATILPEGIFKRNPFISTIQEYNEDILNTLFIREPLAPEPREIELPQYREFLPLLEKEVDAFYHWEAPEYEDYFGVIDEEAEKLAEWKTTERKKKIEFDPDSLSERVEERIERGEFVAPSVF